MFLYFLDNIMDVPVHKHKKKKKKPCDLRRLHRRKLNGIQIKYNQLVKELYEISILPTFKEVETKLVTDHFNNANDSSFWWRIISLEYPPELNIYCSSSKCCGDNYTLFEVLARIMLGGYVWSGHEDFCEIILLLLMATFSSMASVYSDTHNDIVQVRRSVKILENLSQIRPKLFKPRLTIISDEELATYAQSLASQLATRKYVSPDEIASFTKKPREDLEEYLLWQGYYDFTFAKRVTDFSQSHAPGFVYTAYRWHFNLVKFILESGVLPPGIDVLDMCIREAKCIGIIKLNIHDIYSTQLYLHEIFEELLKYVDDEDVLGYFLDEQNSKKLSDQEVTLTEQQKKLMQARFDEIQCDSETNLKLHTLSPLTTMPIVLIQLILSFII